MDLKQSINQSIKPTAQTLLDPINHLPQTRPDHSLQAADRPMWTTSPPEAHRRRLAGSRHSDCKTEEQTVHRVLQGQRSSRMRSDTLCVVTNFSLHCVTVKRSTRRSAPRMCKATTHPRRPRPHDCPSTGRAEKTDVAAGGVPHHHQALGNGRR